MLHDCHLHKVATAAGHPHPHHHRRNAESAQIFRLVPNGWWTKPCTAYTCMSLHASDRVSCHVLHLPCPLYLILQNDVHGAVARTQCERTGRADDHSQLSRAGPPMSAILNPRVGGEMQTQIAIVCEMSIVAACC